MPFYDYQCSNNHKFELKQSFSAEPVATCPECALPAKRLISLVPVHFKGSGFYVNDYAKKAAPGESGESKPADAPAKGADAAKPEAAKTEAPKSPKGDSSTVTKVGPPPAKSTPSTSPAAKA